MEWEYGSSGDQSFRVPQDAAPLKPYTYGGLEFAGMTFRVPQDAAPLKLQPLVGVRDVLRELSASHKTRPH
mgnify:CR=1 FL=1